MTLVTYHLAILICISAVYLTVGNCTPVGKNEGNVSVKSAEFSYDIYSRISKKAPGENVVIGPYTINTALILAYLGANEDVAGEFAPALHLVSNDKNIVSSAYKTTADLYTDDKNLKIANKIYVGTGSEILPNYEKSVKELFNSEIENIDFNKKDKAVNIINNWVSEKTNHKINRIVNSENFNSDTSVFLVNTAYFKSEWEHYFNELLTKKDKFFYQPEQYVEIEMMTFGEILSDSPKLRYGKFDDLRATVVELPFKDSDFAMMVILPNSDETLAELEENLKNKNFMEIANELSPSYVDVKMPKFKIEFGMDLSDVLKDMGIKKAFQGGITEMVNSPKKISSFVHKAFLEIDEKNAEAGAATGLRPGTPSARVPVPAESFTANRPFIYVLKDSKTIQFIGKYCVSERL